MSYIIEKEDVEIVSQSYKLHTKIEIYDNNHKLVNILKGMISAGNQDINNSSHVRRSYSVTIIPSDEQSIDMANNLTLWLDKSIRIFIGLKSVIIDSIKWYPMGEYVLSDSNMIYDAVTNELQLTCVDKMVKLDGTVGGELFGSLSLSIPAYKELFRKSWLDKYESFDAAYSNHHSDDAILKNDSVKDLVSELFTNYSSLSDLEREELVLQIQNECYNYGYTYKIGFGESDDDVILLARYTIKSVIKSILQKYTNIKNYVICDVGEYMGTTNYKYYKQYREENRFWDCVPYDKEFDCGSSVASVIDFYMTLYSGFDYSFDEDGIFKCYMIPTMYEDDVVLNYRDLQNLILNDGSENVTTDYTSIRNVCEIWGKTFETDYYTETCSTSGSKYIVTIDAYDKYTNGDLITVKFDSNSVSNMSMNVNNLGTVLIYNESDDKLISVNDIKANESYTLKYKKSYVNGAYVEKFYLLGQYQVHALSILTDSESDKIYTKEYFQNKYNCKNVRFEVVPESPFTIQKIGEQNTLYQGNEYNNIDSDSSALERASYELWKNCRLTDNVTITTTLLPFLNENVKLSHKKANSNSINQYITQNVHHDFENCTSSIQMYTFYPLYQSTIGQNCQEFSISQYNCQMAGITSLSGEVVIPDTFLHEGIEYRVTSISKDGFANCTNLKSVIIPNTVIEIGDSAFAYCTSLKNVKLPNSLMHINPNTFEKCINLHSFKIPNSVKIIDDAAFKNCANLQTVKIPRSVIKIGDYAFYNTLLRNLEIGGQVNSIGDYAFASIRSLTKLVLGKGIKSIGEGAFNSAPLELIELPNTLEAVGSGSFGNTKIVIYTGDLSLRGVIGASAIKDNYNLVLTSTILSELNLPIINGVLSIPENCTYNDIDLTITAIDKKLLDGFDNVKIVIIPKTVTLLYSNSFNYVKNLQEIVFEETDDVVSINSYSFANCSNLKHVVLPKHMTKLESFLFYNCINLESVVMSDDITTFNQRCFGNCFKLKSFKLPESLNSIQTYSFMNCKSLYEILIPNSVTFIGTYAFINCNLQKVIIEEGSLTVGAYSFYNAMSSDYSVIYLPNSLTSVGYNSFYNAPIIACNKWSLFDLVQRSNLYYYDIGTFDVKYSLKSTDYDFANITFDIDEVIIPYEINYKSNNFKITTIAAKAFSNLKNIENVIISEGIVSILDNAFYNSSLKSLYIPSTAVNISWSFLNGCKSLSSIIVNDKNKNFYVHDNILFEKDLDNEDIYLIKCPALLNIQEYTVSSDVIEIWQTAFQYTNIEILNLPSSLDSLDGSYFYTMDNLKEINIYNGTEYYTSIDGALFTSDKTTVIFVPKLCNITDNMLVVDVTEIGDYAFYGNKTIQRFDFWENVTSIGKWSFAHCPNLQYVNISNVVNSIGIYAFANNLQLTTVNFLSFITYIPDGMFYYCKNLQLIDEDNNEFVSYGVVSIGAYAFYMCYSLSHMIIPSSVTTIGENAFYDIDEITYDGTSETIPDGVTWGAKIVYTTD